MSSDDSSALWAALRSADPVAALHALALCWKKHGQTQAKVIERLMEFVCEVRAEGAIYEDEPIAEVLDFVTGHCAPHLRMF